MPASNPERDPLVKIVMNMYRVIDRYHKENYALREMLLRRGLSPRQLQKEMSASLKHPKPQSRAELQFRELREEMRAFLQNNQTDLTLLAGIPVRGKPQ